LERAMLKPGLRQNLQMRHGVMASCWNRVT
jgi:hypothetical protein